MRTLEKTKSEKWIQEGSFLILSYTINFKGKTSHYLSGPSQDLLAYLKPRAKRVVFVQQPDPVSEDLQPKALCYEKGVLTKELSFPMFWFPMKTGRREIASTPLMYLLFKLRDFFATFYFSFKLKDKFDVCVAVESLNALTAIWLRRFRRCQTVVYDMIDYSPERFSNKTLNRLFHWLDRRAVYQSDFVWNQTKQISEKRFASGYVREKCAPQLVKPTGVLPHKIRQLPLEEIDRHQLVYMGSLLKRDGVELLLRAFKEVVEQVPAAKLVLIGEGEQRPLLETFVQESGLQKQCQFLGIIEDEARLEDILVHSAVGLAPYSDEKGSVKIFNDVSKPKVYLSCGLPVIITRVPAVANEIEAYGAGIAVEYQKEALARAMVKLLKEESLFQSARQNALKMANDFSWDQIFNRLLEPIVEKKN